jgi:hypothetical protein
VASAQRSLAFFKGGTVTDTVYKEDLMSHQRFSKVVDEEVRVLMLRTDYFGRNGSLACFEKQFLTLAEFRLAVGHYGLAMQYLRMLYRALEESFFKGGFSLIRAVHLLKRSSRWIRTIEQSLNFDGTALPFQDLLLIMFVQARNLQILKKTYLWYVMRKTKVNLLKDVEYSYLMIKYKKEDEKEGGFGFFSSLAPSSLSESLYVSLTSNALLFELDRCGFSRSVYSIEAEEEMLSFLKQHTSSEEKETILLMSKLLYSLGDIPKAKEMRIRVEHM